LGTDQQEKVLSSLWRNIENGKGHQSAGEGIIRILNLRKTSSRRLRKGRVKKERPGKVHGKKGE